MKKLYLIAALLLATTSAHAGGNAISFQIEGQRIRIEAPRNCSSLDCIKVTAPGLSGSKFGGFGKSSDDDDISATKPAPAPAQATVTPPPPVPPAPVAAATTNVATVAPAPITTDIAPAPATAAPIAAAPAAPSAAPVAAAPAADPNSPIGVWATEDNKGNVRIESCGTNLCGYAVNSGERILINMRPQDSQWAGKIHDPDSGRTYDSTIAMKGTSTLRVQGCAFGGMFCGGQTWKRVS
jgi:uncharacterized protein (DUF2147 family)